MNFARRIKIAITRPIFKIFAHFFLHGASLCGFHICFWYHSNPTWNDWNMARICSAGIFAPPPHPRNRQLRGPPGIYRVRGVYSFFRDVWNKIYRMFQVYFTEVFRKPQVCSMLVSRDNWRRFWGLVKMVHFYSDSILFCGCFMCVANCAGFLRPVRKLLPFATIVRLASFNLSHTLICKKWRTGKVIQKLLLIVDLSHKSPNSVF